jgi:hypothetical protein
MRKTVRLDSRTIDFCYGSAEMFPLSNSTALKQLALTNRAKCT